MHEQLDVSWVHPPRLSLQVSNVQATPSSHETGVPRQLPLEHWSASVQTLPSSQGVPLGSGRLLHSPVAGSQTPSWTHSPPGGHALGILPTHAPCSHSSSSEQALPSSQAVPFGFGTIRQAPVLGSVSSCSHGPGGSVQSFGTTPTHSPALQASDTVSVSPSSHVVPSARVRVLHRLFSQKASSQDPFLDEVLAVRVGLALARALFALLVVAGEARGQGDQQKGSVQETLGQEDPAALIEPRHSPACTRACQRPRKLRSLVDSRRQAAVVAPPARYVAARRRSRPLRFCSRSLHEPDSATRPSSRT